MIWWRAGALLGVTLCLAPWASAQDSEEEDSLEVVVEGDRPGASPRDPTAASTVIRRRRLARPGSDASDVLSEATGVQVSRTGSSADLATASIRGATSAQAPVYLAGVRLNDDVTGTADLSSVPVWMLDRIEIFRGASPLDADRGGIGGAVFFEPRLPRRAFVGGGAGLGSYGERSLWLSGAQRAGGSAALVALRHDRADNDYAYRDDAGTTLDASDDRVVRRANADFSARDAWAVGRSELPGGARVTTVINAFEREQGLTGLGVIPARAARGRARRLLAGITSRIPCAASPDACQLTLGTTMLRATSHVDDALRELPVGAPWVSSRGTRVAQSFGLATRPSRDWTLRARLGEELEQLVVQRAGGQGTRARRSVTRAAASLGHAPIAPLELLAAGGVECHGTAGPGRSDACGVLAPTGRIGARLEVTPELALLSNLSRNVRVPTLGELYGVSATISGNPALESETAWSADAGLRAASAAPGLALGADVVGFARFARDLVAYRRSGLGVIRPYNVAEGRALGLESSAYADALRHLRWESSVTLLDPRDVTPGRTISNDLVPFRSRLVSVQRVEIYARRPLSSVARVAAGATWKYRSSQVADAAGLVIIDQEHVVDFDVATELWRGGFALRAALENAFDAPRFDSVGLPLPGRSAHLAAEVSLR